MPNIYVIDDEANIRTMLREALTGEGYDVQCFADSSEAIATIQKVNPDLVITDLVMPGIDGIGLIQKTKTINPEINILLITAYASIESAVKAIRAGACDYLVKPFKIDDLLNAVKKALSQKRLMPEFTGKNVSLHEKYNLKNFIGATPEMKSVFGLIEKVAKTDSSVLIMGESGTGKEMVARAIHYHSKRAKGTFVSINCAALPETLLESELFGYEKGAFTGAGATKEGLFELAEEGTFLLDEIGDMSVNLQVKLLRVLQERNFKRLGGVRDISVDFRLLAATSKNLHEEIKAKKFREDLFYRLNVIPIVLPPLRNRKDDIPVFVYYFLGLFSARNNVKKKLQVTPEGMAVFQDHSWPGNIRELENVLERLITLLEGDVIDANAVRNALNAGNLSLSQGKTINIQDDLKQSVESFERDIIEEALKEEKGNKNKAAKKLHLTRQALHYKLKKYGIESDEKED